MYITGTLFFFQAEDGIRDGHVTGVQTCALPIYPADNRQGFIACRKSEAPKKIAWQGGCSRFCVSNTITWRRTVAGAVYTIETSRTFQQQGETDKAFIYTDHLGSTDVITDKGGNVVQSMSFDAWGQRRDADSWDLVTDVIAQRFTERTSRGYTSHEQLDEVGLIHMNGRIYDPRLARFLQADPFIQAPGNTQSYNRYSYLWNNPLNATDPSGFILKKLWDNIRPVVGAIVAAVLCYAANCLGSTEDMIWIGGGRGAVGAAANGADTSGIMLGAMTGMASGANIYLGAIVAGVSAHAQGGSFGRTFAAAGVGAMVSGLGLQGPQGFIVASVVGGVSSEITGGKFKNGAATAAFSWVLARGINKLATHANDSIEYFNRDSDPVEFTYEERVKLGDQLRSQRDRLQGVLSKAESGDAASIKALNEYVGPDINEIRDAVAALSTAVDKFPSSNFRRLYSGNGSVAATFDPSTGYVALSKTVFDRVMSGTMDYALIHEVAHFAEFGHANFDRRKNFWFRHGGGVGEARSAAASGQIENYTNPYAYQGLLESF